MAADPRVQQLLEEVLDTSRTPEERLLRLPPAPTRGTSPLAKVRVDPGSASATFSEKKKGKASLDASQWFEWTSVENLAFRRRNR